MTRYFNTTGPCVPGEHYMLPPERRLERVRELIDRGRYFSLAAGRQTGKTTCLQWLVNALADYAVDRLERDRSKPISAAHIDAAKDAMILDRRTHIDSLLARLEEPRVRRVIDPMLAGGWLPFSDVDGDLQYVAGLGLIRKVEGRWEVANPIYREVVPRTLGASAQESLDQRTAWYVGEDGLLDVPKLMAAWQKFWRQDGHLAAEGFSYKESGPHLMLIGQRQLQTDINDNYISPRSPRSPTAVDP